MVFFRKQFDKNEVVYLGLLILGSERFDNSQWYPIVMMKRLTSEANSWKTIEKGTGGNILTRTAMKRGHHVERSCRG